MSEEPRRIQSACYTLGWPREMPKEEEAGVGQRRLGAVLCHQSPFL